MVRTVSKSNEADFFRVLSCNPLFGATIRANYEVYGQDARYLSLWLVYNEQAQPHMVVQYYQETITLCCAPEDDDVTFFASFLSIAPPWRSIIGPERMVASLPPRVTDGRGMRTGSVMVLDGAPVEFAPPKGTLLVTKLNFRSLFTLLGECSDEYKKRADYHHWYTDLSYRLRHGGARVTALKADGLYASSASAYISGGIAVVRDVCTLTDKRGCGYAKAVVFELCRSLHADGIRPYLLSVSPEADALYHKSGFRVQSLWAALYNNV